NSPSPSFSCAASRFCPHCRLSRSFPAGILKRSRGRSYLEDGATREKDCARSSDFAENARIASQGVRKRSQQRKDSGRERSSLYFLACCLWRRPLGSSPTACHRRGPVPAASAIVPWMHQS